MKDIRIFVASSKALEKKRNCLAFLVQAKEDEFAKRGLRVRLAKTWQSWNSSAVRPRLRTSSASSPAMMMRWTEEMMS